MSLFKKKKKKAPPPPQKAGRMAPQAEEPSEESPDEGGGLIQTATKSLGTPQGKAVLGALALWAAALYFMNRKR